MGKGDRRTRRGKIYAGSFGKTRPKDVSRPRAAAPAAPVAATKASASKKK